MTNDQTLSAYLQVYRALDIECCSDAVATILSPLLIELSRHYRESTGETVGKALGWDKPA
tara:strand:+ start:463 stop:642 length:180 start_codon:yes stop_codon:yes gene_type:complete